MSTIERMQPVISWLALGLLALLPFFFVPVAWISVAQSKMLLLAALGTLLFMGTAFYAVRARSVELPGSLLLYAAALVPLAYLFSAIVSGAGFQSYVGGSGEQDTVLAIFLSYAVFLSAAALLMRRISRVHAALYALLAGAGALGGIQLVHLFMPSVTFSGVLPVPAASVIGSWQDFGIYMGLALYLSFALLALPAVSGARARYALMALAAVSAFFTVIIHSRDVLAVLAFAFAATGAYVWYAKREGAGRFFSRATVPWLLGALGALLLIFAGPYLNAALPERIQVPHVEVRPSWQGTLEIGKGVFSTPKDVFFGSGPNTFPQAWGMYKPLSVNETQFWDVDFNSGVGFIPTSFVTEGLIGFLAWAAVCLAVLMSVWLFVRERSELTEQATYRWALLVAAVFLTVFHVMYVPSIALSVLAFCVFGALVAAEAHAGAVARREVPLALGSWRGTAALGVACVFSVLLLFGSVQSVRAVASDALVNRAIVQYSRNQSDLARVSQSINSALAVLPGSDRANRAAVELGILQMAQLIAQGADASATQQLQETLSTAIQHGLAAVRTDGADYQNWLTLARFYSELAGLGVQGADSNAYSAFQEARATNPRNPLPLIGMARVDIGRGDDTAARTRLQEALALKSDFAAAHFLLSQIEARGSNFEAARTYAANAVQLAPQDPLGWYNLGTVLYASGSFSEARMALERAAGLQNNYANALFLLGLTYAQLGQNNEALAALRAVQALNPDDENLRNVIESLRTGTSTPAALPAAR